MPEDQIKKITVKVLVDTGAYMLIINEKIREQLDLPVIDEQVFRMADDSERPARVVGPVEIRFENRRASVDAVVLGEDNEVLLGSILLEDLDVLIDPKQRRLIVNPASPDIATKYLK